MSRFTFLVGLVACALASVPASAQSPQDEGPEELESPFVDERPAEGEGNDDGSGVTIRAEGEASPALQPVPAQPGPTPGPPEAPQGYAPPPPGYADPNAAPAPAYGPPGEPYSQGATYHREPYVEGMQLPPNAQVDTRVRKGLLISGIALFAATYVSTVFTWWLFDVFGGAPDGMLVPFIGPFFLFPDAEPQGRTILTVLALAQMGGFAMLLAGALTKQKMVVWYGDSGVAIRPLATAGGGGVHLTYDF